jgi:hypothetical protein
MLSISFGHAVGEDITAMLHLSLGEAPFHISVIVLNLGTAHGSLILKHF